MQFQSVNERDHYHRGADRGATSAVDDIPDALSELSEPSECRTRSAAVPVVTCSAPPLTALRGRRSLRPK